MKKLILATIALTLAAPAFAGTKAPVAPAASTLVDSSGKAVIAGDKSVSIAPFETAAVETPETKKATANPKAKKGAAHKSTAKKPAVKKDAAH
jgi:hypothetical protein